MTEYSELVNALRCCIQNPPKTCVGCKYNIGNNECAVRGMMCDAAAAIEALQAELIRICKQLPKRGEWIIHGEPPMLVLECSVCGQKYFNHVMQEKAKYCSMCGAKMTEVRE